MKHKAVALSTILVFLLLLTGCGLTDKGPELKNWEPVLSPDGSTIAFETPNEAGFELYLLNLNTNEQTQLTSNDVDDWSPSWSPDGRQIVFVSNREKNVDLYTVAVSTGTITRLTIEEGDDVNPYWGKDNRIVFNSNRSGIWQIYSIDPDGHSLVKITKTQEED